MPRFGVGTLLMCNLGQGGWTLGRVVAQNYREEHWPADQVAPYQVALEGDHSLIYVPHDDSRCCREATREDVNIERRLDALAQPHRRETDCVESDHGVCLLSCETALRRHGVSGYRDGRCHGSDCCPRFWSCVELYSEHYRAASRNGLSITRRAADLGTIRVGGSVDHPASDFPASGFMQCPSLPRLPPGVRWTDDGALRGDVRFDPYRPASYKVEFVAVSTAAWDTSVGLVRVEITFTVEGNVPPDDFDERTFQREQQVARVTADRLLRALGGTWERWVSANVGNSETIDRMSAQLHELRELLERHPRLGGGFYWAELGGFHMNVHKLLENTLFECELYLGHALLFGGPEVRRIAEANLEGCFQKRLLETARFVWMDGVAQMQRAEWSLAAETLHLAADQSDGWGWGVNNGDIWIAEGVARLIHGAELDNCGADGAEVARQLAEVTRLLEKGAARAAEGHFCGRDGHPWASETSAALAKYRELRETGAGTAAWLEEVKKRTIFWCAQVLGGAAPFPPKPRPRLHDAEALRVRLLKHNE